MGADPREETIQVERPYMDLAVPTTLQTACFAFG
jgi:hypothetical protein